jgi:hypothetical protein
MADINEIKERVMDTLGSVADVTRDLAAKAAEKARQGARIAKLTVEIGNEKDNMKKAYMEIGKLYYETRKDEPGGFFGQLCDEITMAIENIADKETEIAELKSRIKDFDGGDIEVEVEETEIYSEEVPEPAAEEKAADDETPDDTAE